METDCLVCGKTFRCYPYRKGTVKYCSRECQAKAFTGKPNKAGQKSDVKYSGIHMWIRRYLPTTKCENCSAENVTLNRANISGKYLRELSDWKILCLPCHQEFDGNNKIPNSENERIIAMRHSGMTFVAIAKTFSVTRKAISKRYYRVINS